MSVSVSTVRDSDPDRLVDAADALGRRRSELETILTGEREMLAHLQEHWTGQAATGAVAQGVTDLAQQDRIARRLRNLESALRNGGVQMAALRDALLDLVSTLDRFGFAVADDGTVTPQQWLVGRFLDSLADKFTAFLKKMLQLLTDLDENTASAIDQAAGVDIPSPPVAVGGQSIQIPSTDTDPADVTTWWNALTDDQRRGLIDQHPPILGNLNGIPAEVRDQVNVAVMDDDLDRVENVASRNHVPADEVVGNPGRYGLTDSDVTRYQNAKRTQEGLLHQLGAPDGESRRYSEIGAQERHDRNWRPTMLWAYDPQAFDGKAARRSRSPIRTRRRTPRSLCPAPAPASATAGCPSGTTTRSICTASHSRPILVTRRR
ncbi:WXG100 family type VII secretion target [Mycolicibacterium flavescens]|uniref:WXG100 family type VII secretion target n=1 Tax=Mycolicibacterium flavescens TaxID=1776 RepID=UPI000A60554C|nr:hypothetical protein [Mycolicibacterium flavescens]